MKSKLLFIVLILLNIITPDAHCISYIQMLDMIRGKYIVNNGQVTFSTVIQVDSVSKEDLFDRSLEYFSYGYAPQNLEVQITDKNKSYIVANGLYPDVFNGANSFLGYDESIDASHVIKIESRDNRVKVSITVTNLDKTIKYWKGGGSYEQMLLSEMYPFVELKNEEGMSRKEKSDLKLVYRLYIPISASFERISNFLNDQTLRENTNEDW